MAGRGGARGRGRGGRGRGRGRRQDGSGSSSLPVPPGPVKDSQGEESGSDEVFHDAIADIPPPISPLPPSPDGRAHGARASVYDLSSSESDSGHPSKLPVPSLPKPKKRRRSEVESLLSDTPPSKSPRSELSRGDHSRTPPDHFQAGGSGCSSCSDGLRSLAGQVKKTKSKLKHHIHKQKKFNSTTSSSINQINFELEKINNTLKSQEDINGTQVACNTEIQTNILNLQRDTRNNSKRNSRLDKRIATHETSIIQTTTTLKDFETKFDNLGAALHTYTQVRFQ